MPTAVFCNVPLSTSFSCDLEKSTLSLEWVLASGVQAKNSVVSVTTERKLSVLFKYTFLLPHLYRLIWSLAETGFNSLVIRYQMHAFISHQITCKTPPEHRLLKRCFNPPPLSLTIFYAIYFLDIILHVHALLYFMPNYLLSNMHLIFMLYHIMI
ncbi:hypothetical protein K438DRAFT_1785396 [Mycena galopus ATCC 62051]|nr:hypothetical protein K438DRAFT_1785396 [Mycena galopus ATCC 62051]